MTGQNSLFEGLLGMSDPEPRKSFAEVMYTHPTSGPSNSLLAAALMQKTAASDEPEPNKLMAWLLAGMPSPEINTSDRLRHLAGKLMHHPDPEVRELAGLGLRHVERFETGK